MGIVYRAQDLRLGRGVALKFLPAALGRDAAALERLRREARAASALNHPNICTIHDIGEDAEGRAFLVLELLEGETLQARLRRGSLATGEVLELGIETAAALEAAHAKGIVHRDLKPANIFLTREGHAKVLDFGLAKLLPSHAAATAGEDAPTAAGLGASELTQAGAALGTVAYMSPEQAQAEHDYQAWERTYPNDPLPFGNECAVASHLDPPNEINPGCNAAFKLDPNNVVYVANWAIGLAVAGRRSESEAVFADGLKRWPDNLNLHETHYEAGIQFQDATTLASETAWLGARGNGGMFRNFNAAAARNAGELGKQEALLQQNEAAAAGNPSAAAGDELNIGMGKAWYGQHAEAEAAADRALKISRDHGSVTAAALIYAAAGDVVKANAPMAELDRSVGQQSFYRIIGMAEIRAAVALAQHQPAQAIAALVSVEPYEAGDLGIGLPAYLRGMALIQEGQGAAALAEFQKVVGLPTETEFPVLARLGTARAQVMAGDMAGARATYRAVLEQWKDADAGVPVIVAARAEYAKLR